MVCVVCARVCMCRSYRARHVSRQLVNRYDVHRCLHGVTLGLIRSLTDLGSTHTYTNAHTHTHTHTHNVSIYTVRWPSNHEGARARACVRGL